MPDTQRDIAKLILNTHEVSQLTGAQMKGELAVYFPNMSSRD